MRRAPRAAVVVAETAEPFYAQLELPHTDISSAKVSVPWDGRGAEPELTEELADQLAEVGAAEYANPSVSRVCIRVSAGADGTAPGVYAFALQKVMYHDKPWMSTGHPLGAKYEPRDYSFLRAQNNAQE